MSETTGRDQTTGTVEGGEQVAVGRGNKQNSRRDSARSDPQQNMFFNNPDNMQIWVKLLDLTADIRDLNTKMDDLPGRVGRLERLEVVVRPSPEIVVHPVSDSINLSARVIFTVLAVALLFVLALVGFLLYLQVLRV